MQELYFYVNIQVNTKLWPYKNFYVKGIAALFILPHCVNKANVHQWINALISVINPHIGTLLNNE